MSHRVVPADAHRVPLPFTAFAVRSDEPAHARLARTPYGRVHLLHADFLDVPAMAVLAATGLARAAVPDFPDVDYATTTWQELAILAPSAIGLAERVARAVQTTGVLGDEPDAARHSVAGRVDFLVSGGAGFHNDVGRHWPRCLFWILALAADDVEFVMPHAGVRVPMAPGDLLLFDQTMAHGLCRPGDDGLAQGSSFAPVRHAGPGGAALQPLCDQQVFLTGELLLEDARWAALGAAWLPVTHPDRRDALDLMVAEFDDRSGAIKRVRSLVGCMAV